MFSHSNVHSHHIICFILVTRSVDAFLNRKVCPHVKPMANFNLNKLAHKLIDNKIYLNEEEMSLKQKIEESIKVFYEMYEDFTLSKTKLFKHRVV